MEKSFSEYMKIGGLPYVAGMSHDQEKRNLYLEGIYNTVILNDIEERQSRKEKEPAKRKINDIALLKMIAKYLAGSVGSLISVRNVTNYLVSTGRKVSPNTVDDYVDALCESFIFYTVERFDVSGKEILKNNRKYYMVDLGLRNFVLPRKQYDIGFSFENVIYFELLRRGCQVYIGKIGNAEVDFVARKDEDIIYYQVTADMTSEETFEREMASLRKIKDNYEKIVLTLDHYTPGNYEGIKVVNALEWLLGE